MFIGDTLTEDNRLIALDGKFELTPTSLDVKGVLPVQDWLDYGEYKLQYVEGALQWWIGDYLNEFEGQHGEMYAQAVDDSQAESWKKYKWVSKRVEKGSRLHLLSWSHHQAVASLPPTEQKRWLQKTLDNHWNRNELRAAIRDSKRIEPPTLEGKYHIIYADPPWRYDYSLSDSRMIENQYPTMEIDDICALPIGDIADKNCVLFLWATSPKLPEAMQVVESWGFNYRTCMVWVKDRIGMGYYARQRHELLLIATVGEPSVPAPVNRPDSVISAPRTKHSKKPEEVYNIIETMYPGSTKIELFARNNREEWAKWGDQL